MFAGGPDSAARCCPVSERIAARFLWAVEVMAPRPTDRLLEIGGGPGIIVSLICPMLSSGQIHGIDRSKPATAHAARRNARCVEEGRASFEAVALADADLGRGRFDTAFAINVRLFRTNAAREADVLQRGLKPKGTLYLFQQHPSAERTRAVTEELRAALTDNGFDIQDVLTKGSGAATMTSIEAAPVSRSDAALRRSRPDRRRRTAGRPRRSAPW